MMFDKLFPDGLSTGMKLTTEQINGIHEVFNKRENDERLAAGMIKDLNAVIDKYEVAA